MGLALSGPYFIDMKRALGHCRGLFVFGDPSLGEILGVIGVFDRRLSFGW